MQGQWPRRWVQVKIIKFRVKLPVLLDAPAQPEPGPAGVLTSRAQAGLSSRSAVYPGAGLVWELGGKEQSDVRSRGYHVSRDDFMQDSARNCQK